MKKEIKIGEITISNESSVFLIAEIGTNHSNDLERAYSLIDQSKASGAHAVKFQSFKAETLYSKFTPRRKMADGSFGPEIYPMIEKVQMPYSWHSKLKKYCDLKSIIFMSSPFDLEAIESLEAVDCPAYKIASSELGDPILLKAVARTKKPIILSTGKADLDEVEEAVRWIRGEGNEQIILLHCTATYPADYQSMNLKAISTMIEHFECLVGLSDHNLENLTAVAAVALGAKVIEKHITYDRSATGPDHHFALTPGGFRELSEWILKTESSLGNGEKVIQESELEGKRIANRSIHVNKKLPIGHILTESDLIIKRPSLGISPREYRQIVGRQVTSEIEADMWLTWQDIQK